ncbi:hypothetical protein RIF29_38388 [Crotalaria pallida]|uniref:Uncharacterized protein n=1 Tax=Crotalaria pallida TaxID=3830 RepID=A0AAN9DZ75_CROPI
MSESRGRQDDDLTFFVLNCFLGSQGSNSSGESVDPYFVGRWAPKLSDLVGESSIDVDWRGSFYLNLIAHTSFSVTVAICRLVYRTLSLVGLFSAYLIKKLYFGR